MSKREQRRQTILDAALELFVQKGIHPTTTAEISSKAGIAAGTLFNYFKTKDELISSLYIETKREMFSAFEGSLKEEDDYYQILKQFWKLGVNWGVQNYPKIQFLNQMEESPFIPQEMKKEIEEMFSKYFNTYQEAISQKLIKNIPLDFSIALTYQTILTTIDYITKNIITPSFNQEEIIDQAFDVYLNGMRMK